MKIKNLHTLAIIAAFSLCTSSSIASNKVALENNNNDNVVISGFITNVKGKAIKGVAIKSLDSDKYTLTDKKGHYEIETQPNSQLLISYIGYASDTITATKSEQRNIQLYTKEDHKETIKTNNKKGNWFGGVGVGASTTF